LSSEPPAESAGIAANAMDIHVSSNPYCEALQIQPPRLEAVRDRAEANTFSLLIVALLERGAPMTLAEVAARFEVAGIDIAAGALRSLQRCRPDRSPVHRDGDLYALDPHDDEADLWAFRLGLRPARWQLLQEAAPPPVQEPAPEALPGPEVPLRLAELEEAFRDQYLQPAWSAIRLAIAVTDAHDGRIEPARAEETLNRLATHHALNATTLQLGRGAPIELVGEFWVLEPTHPKVAVTRAAVRGQIARLRERRTSFPSAEETRARMRLVEKARAARAAELARLQRVIVHAFPSSAPRIVTIIDVATREISTLMDEEISRLPDLLDRFDVIAAAGVRPLLQGLDYAPGSRRLAELGPPQKSITLDRRRRVLRITLPMLVRGSCGISRPFGDPDVMAGYLATGSVTRLRRRMEADAKSLFALYQYGRLHGAVRLRWGFLDEMLRVPWVDSDEPRLGSVLREAHRRGEDLEVVMRTAPGWEDPWSRAVRCTVHARPGGYGWDLVTPDGYLVDEEEVQAVRAVPGDRRLSGPSGHLRLLR
jgi:hypothetical protein